MNIFERFAKKAAVKKVEKVVDDNWDTILEVIGIIIGIGVFVNGCKRDEPKKSNRDIPTTVKITTTYNYYGNGGKNCEKE